MKQRINYVLDVKDRKIAKLFADLGMPTNLAKTLLYVSQVDECLSADIERGASLRQPEVSIAMQELRKRGWVKKRDRKKEGKGRPVHIYKFIVDLPEIVKDIEKKKMIEVESVKKDLSELKTMIEKR